MIKKYFLFLFCHFHIFAMEMPAQPSIVSCLSKIEKQIESQLIAALEQKDYESVEEFLENHKKESSTVKISAAVIHKAKEIKKQEKENLLRAKGIYMLLLNHNAFNDEIECPIQKVWKSCSPQISRHTTPELLEILEKEDLGLSPEVTEFAIKILNDNSKK